jgi:hypothetical protein
MQVAHRLLNDYFTDKYMVYVFELIEGKYYIGDSHNFIRRCDGHFDGNTVWTKKYPIVKLIEMVPDPEWGEEHRLTIKYMDKYGVDNVRGAEYTSIYLSADQRKLIQRTLYSINGQCYNCGSKAHLSSRCDQRKITNYYSQRSRSNDSCFSCKQLGHWATDCPNKSRKRARPINSIPTQPIPTEPIVLKKRKRLRRRRIIESSSEESSDDDIPLSQLIKRRKI